MKFVIFALLAIVIIRVLLIKRVTVFEYEKALKYTKGKFRTVLGPGKYFIFSPNVTIQKVDIRPKFMTVSGQEVLSEDGISIKASIAVEYEINEPYFALNKVEDYSNALYTTLQLILREIISDIKIEEVMISRRKINEALMENAYKRALGFGLKLKYVSIKDVMFPGELKKIFSQVVKARKEGLAALERARGETAALRSLANASKMLENNPALMKLKLLQSTGNTIVVGLPENFGHVKCKDAKA